MNYNGSSLYGNYRTRTFAEIFPDIDAFTDDWELTPFPAIIESIPFDVIFALLYSRYGNSNIASSDENRFKYELYSLIFQYGPSWYKEFSIQKEIRALNIDDLRTGSQNIVNLASNPSTAPSTVDTEELPFVNNQNVTKTKRSIADGYALMLSLLKDDVTETFLQKFKKLFLTIVEPELPLWYVTYPEEE